MSASLAMVGQKLPCVRIDGMFPDTLGNYYACLGLFRLASGPWPGVRCCWQNGAFYLIGGPPDREALLAHIAHLVDTDGFMKYDPKGWADFRADPHELEVYRSWVESEDEASQVYTHVVPSQGSRCVSNPALGYNGTIGKRVFANGYLQAIQSVQGKQKLIKLQGDLQKAQTKLEVATQAQSKKTGAALVKAQKGVQKAQKNVQSAQKAVAGCLEDTEAVRVFIANKREDLRNLLTGAPCVHLDTSAFEYGHYHASSWFPQATEMANYDSGKPESCKGVGRGRITPWLMIFACYGVVFFSGSITKRYGANSRRFGAYPFTFVASDLGIRHRNELYREGTQHKPRTKGEVWAPIWERALTIQQVDALFAEGRAEVSKRVAANPGMFVAAVCARGVDECITRFHRFGLSQTTSSNTYESSLDAIVIVPDKNVVGQAEALSKIAMFRSRFPYERKVFHGMSAALDDAMARVLSNRGAPEESARDLCDTLAEVVSQIDKRKDFRSLSPSLEFPLLPMGWFPALFGESEVPPVEARLAVAIASIQGEGDNGPFFTNRWGVSKGASGRWCFQKKQPHTRVWSSSDVIQDLTSVVLRRFVDSGPYDRVPLWSRLDAHPKDVLALLTGAVDLEELARWLDRAALFQWQFPRRDRPENPKLVESFTTVRALVSVEYGFDPAQDSAGCLYGLLKPLFSSKPLLWEKRRSNPKPSLFQESTTPSRTGALRQIATLLDGGSVDRAVEVAYSRYAVGRRRLLKFQGPFALEHPELLLAALLVPVQREALSRYTHRWLCP